MYKQSGEIPDLQIIKNLTVFNKFKFCLLN